MNSDPDWWAVIEKQILHERENLEFLISQVIKTRMELDSSQDSKREKVKITERRCGKVSQKGSSRRMRAFSPVEYADRSLEKELNDQIFVTPK